MTREEYYAGIEAYKNKLEHRAMDANAEDTAGKALENWKNQYLNQAINLRAKQYLASKFGRTDDASTYEKQLQILLDKMTNLKGVSLSAKQALMQTIDQTATNKANVQYAKHSDESDEVLEHGGEWKKHKYIRIENGRYIYPEDDKASKQLEKKLDKNASDIARAYLSGDKDAQAKAHNDYANIVVGYGLDSKARGNTSRGIEEKQSAKINEKIKEASKAGSGESYERAQREGEAMQAWKDAKKSKSNENARSEIEETGSISKETKTESSRQSLESASKAQKEGEAMQAWKNQKAIKEAAKNGESESYEKAKAEGDAYQKWKDAQANKVSESSKGTSGQTADEYFKNYRKNTEEMATVRSNGSILFNILAYKAYNDDSLGGSGYDTGKVAQILANNLYSNYSAALNNGLSKEESKKFVEKYVEEMYDAIKTSAGLSGYETTMNPIEVSYDSNGAPTNVNVKFYSIKKKEAKHSLNLTKEEYYAGIEEYKRKKK